MHAYVKERQTHFNQIVSKFLPCIEKNPSILHKAMHYAVSVGGKRMRPLLVYATGELLGQTIDQLDRIACGVEFIHTYSLIHDDLPSMDNSDFRRNKPACHKVFGEATAILAGNALQNLAFDLIAQDDAHRCEFRLEMIKTLSHAVGSEGVLGGQILDLNAIAMDLDIAQIEKIHQMKTAALIAASVRLGALAAKCYETQLLEKLAYDFGLAFQIADDILDKEEKGSLNYANQIGLREAEARVESLYQSVFLHLELFSKKQNNPLYYVIDYIKEAF